MNEKKICFISCVNNERLYEENLLYINNLEIPQGYEVETLAIRGAKSMTSGYNQGISMTDAKYKVYTHQDVVIVNKNFIRDMIKVFQDNSNIGLMGLTGTKQLPANANWWESPYTFGKVYENHTGTMVNLSFAEINGDYESVRALDGLLLMTQYDVKWREDLFQGFHFYDISQCMEFIKAGYEVGIPKQTIPWAVHDCGLKQDKGDFLVYEGYRAKFLNEYAKDMFPLVSILIPAYNQTKYLKVAIDSAINQTYQNTEIIICDDSTTEDVRALVSRYDNVTDKIRYYNNGGPLGEHGILNCEKCFDLAKGEYISFLFHDDEYYPTKVEKMVTQFMLDKTITLVASQRTLINSDGNIIRDIWGIQSQTDRKVTGEEMGRTMLLGVRNVIGEPTTVLFRKKDIVEDGGRLFNYYDVKMNFFLDIPLFLKLCAKGNVYIYKEHLSKFRMHKEQNTYDKSISMWPAIDFFNMIIFSYENGLFIKNKGELKRTLQVWVTRYIKDINLLLAYEENENEQINTFKKKYVEYIKLISMPS